MSLRFKIIYVAAEVLLAVIDHIEISVYVLVVDSLE
jgi:hypothetical protein